MEDFHLRTRSKNAKGHVTPLSVSAVEDCEPCLFLFCIVRDIRLVVTREVNENTALSLLGQLCLTSENVRAVTQTRPVNQS